MAAAKSRCSNGGHSSDSLRQEIKLFRDISREGCLEMEYDVFQIQDLTQREKEWRPKLSTPLFPCSTIRKGMRICLPLPTVFQLLKGSIWWYFINNVHGAGKHTPQSKGDIREAIRIILRTLISYVIDRQNWSTSYKYRAYMLSLRFSRGGKRTR